jgi:hypothetical protein
MTEAAMSGLGGSIGALFATLSIIQNSPASTSDFAGD